MRNLGFPVLSIWCPQKIGRRWVSGDGCGPLLISSAFYHLLDKGPPQCPWSLSTGSANEQPLGKIRAQTLHSEPGQSLRKMCPRGSFLSRDRKKMTPTLNTLRTPSLTFSPRSPLLLSKSLLLVSFLFYCDKNSEHEICPHRF